MTRRILVVAHTGRPEITAAAAEAVTRFRSQGIEVLVATDERGVDLPADLRPAVRLWHVGEDLDGVELAMAIGGDGTILRAAEAVRPLRVPILGVNLGHVGFLAESERDALPQVLDRVVDRDYTIEHRLSLDVEVCHGDRLIGRSWAVNEVSVEKADRSRMIELVSEVDGRPVSTFGCDGIVLATPTGSTAYAFSAGGPIVWPEVEALLLVPISAHALFARPMVTSPQSTLAVEVLGPRDGAGLWCDGRRHIAVPKGGRVEVRRGAQPILLARLGDGPFTDRLVEKFRLPVRGWRGPHHEQPEE